VFEAGKVDVVFAGHVHNYQRSFPLKFVPDPPGPKKNEVAGGWVIDELFGDGAKTAPNAPIYIVSGGGGADLYDREQMKDPNSWQSFTNKFISDTHSFSLVEIDGKTFRLRQISETGTEVDSFRIAK
jgi:hypothetical protein